MIKVVDDTEEKCQECPMFECVSYMHQDCMKKTTIVSVKCKHKWLCNRLENNLKERKII